MVVHAYNPSTQEETGESLVQGQPKLHNEALPQKKIKQNKKPDSLYLKLNRRETCKSSVTRVPVLSQEELTP
jgi:hypothetical protein